MARRESTHLRINPTFAALVRRMIRDGSRAEQRVVTASEVTGMIASCTPSTWAALCANLRAPLHQEHD